MVKYPFNVALLQFQLANGGFELFTASDLRPEGFLDFFCCANVIGDDLISLTIFEIAIGLLAALLDGDTAFRKSVALGDIGLLRSFVTVELFFKYLGYHVAFCQNIPHKYYKKSINVGYILAHRWWAVWQWGSRNDEAHDWLSEMIFFD